MIQHKERYLEYIKQQGVGANDQVASSPASYVSYLNGVSRLLGADILPQLLHSADEVKRIATQLRGDREPGTIRNYSSAMRQYVAMVHEDGLWRFSAGAAEDAYSEREKGEQKVPEGEQKVPGEQKAKG